MCKVDVMIPSIHIVGGVAAIEVSSKYVRLEVCGIQLSIVLTVPIIIILFLSGTEFAGGTV